MKKIILFICLFVGINVQGQILGGYVTNSVLTNSYVPYSGATKSVNLGSQILRTTGASTLGSLYVPGAITATGQVNANTLSITATSTLTGQAKLTATNNIVGLSTVLTQSTVTLTTPASSGTLANLADAVMRVDNFVTASTLADAQTYYFCHIPFGVTLVNSKLRINGNWTLYAYQFEAWCNGTPSSAETATLNYQINTTTTTVRSDVTFTVSGANTYTGTLNVSLSDGDMLNTQIITPTFATNPTATGITMSYWLRRRQ